MLELSSFDLHRLKSFKSHLKQSSVSEEDDMGPWLSHGLIQIKILGINEREDISIHWRFSCSQPDGIITVYTLAGFWYPYRILSVPMEASGLSAAAGRQLLTPCGLKLQYILDPNFFFIKF
nr:hypothetical protein Iba_chr04aCG16500 [Ipomoea batatas]